MRLAGSRCRPPLVIMVALFLATTLLVVTDTPFAGAASRARAGGVPLAVNANPILSVVTESIGLSVQGQVSTSLNGSHLVVVAKGPVAAGDVGRADVDAPEAARVVERLGGAPGNTAVVTSETDLTSSTEASSGAQTAAGSALSSTTEASSTTTTTVDPLLEQGVLDVEVVLPPDALSTPGAYLVEIRVESEGQVLASGRVWLGRAAARDTPLDVAFVLPLALGIHRDHTGAYFDRTLEQAVTADGVRSGSLLGLAALNDYPEWRFSLAVEPVLLTQLRDMEDGYVRTEPPGERIELGVDDPAAVGAGMVLSGLKDLATRDSIEVLVGPYAGADLESLAAEGWRDGLEQLQLGKMELQQVLGLGSPIIGAYAPDLDLTSGSLASYAAASIDHVVVDSRLSNRLVEPAPDGAVAVRARNKENDRATLVFASEDLDGSSTAGDDVLIGATLAAALASGPREALVIVPEAGSTIPSASYLERLGRVLTDAGWIRTLTLAELIREHSPGARPTLLDTGPDTSQGYIQQSLLEALRSAHAAVSDLAAMADPTRGAVETAYRLLFLAESRWWSRPDTSPQEASIGLAYAAEAQAVAEAELKKVRFVGGESTSITGGSGVVTLVAESTADFALSLELHLTGEGITFPDGERVSVELEPGRNELPVNVVCAEGPHSLVAELLAGTTVLDTLSGTVRFIGLTTVLPGAIVGALVVGTGVYLIARRRRRKRRASSGV